MTAGLDVSHVLAAQQTIAGHVSRTPLLASEPLSAAAGTPVHLKHEQLQITGAFKLRGATNALLNLSEAERERGVIAVSTGNHGRGLAHAARQLGLRAVICMSTLVPDNKIAAIRALGAEIHIAGASQDEAEQEATRLIEAEGLTYIPPFDHRDVIAGQGTIGLELVEDLPELATVIVPLSGGGLLGGIALAVRAARPDAQIIGVTMKRGAAMHASLQAGKPVPVTETRTLADSLGGGIGLDNRHTFALIRDLVDQVVLLEEDEIAEGIRHAYRKEGVVLEGAAAVTIAAVLSNAIRPAGPTALVLSGRNIDISTHHEIVGNSSP